MSKDIGEKAGVVWRYIDEHGPVTISGLMRETKLSQRDADRAVGWLAREGKIQIQKQARKELITLE